tara:strand:+ start:366 stop:551 length:186 start_codon:yes stop_codon:yes gene_type:complete
MDDIIINTEDGMRISVCQWDNDGAWLHLSSRSGTTYAALTRGEAQELFQSLLTVLDAEVAA